jgi:hypothetical protein
LIKSLPIARIRIPDTLKASWSPRSQLLHSPTSSSLLAFSPSDLIEGYAISLTDLIAGQPSGFTTIENLVNHEETTPVQLKNTLSHFVRTPNGRGLLAICENGDIAVWSKEKVDNPVKGKEAPKSLAGKGQWNMSTTPLHSAIFAKGRAVVFFTKDEQGPRITIQHLDPGSSQPTEPVPMPGFQMEDDDDVAMLLAVSDIDDGISRKGRRTQRAVVMAVTASGQAWCWRVTSTTNEVDNDRPDIQLLHKYRLPIQGGSSPALVLPVDPMGWHTSVIDWKSDTPLQDMVLTISTAGVLEYWQPRLGQHLAVQDGATEGQKVNGVDGEAWVRSGFVDTGRTNVVMARCSSRKKTVLSEFPNTLKPGADEQSRSCRTGDRKLRSGIRTLASFLQVWN